MAKVSPKKAKVSAKVSARVTKTAKAAKAKNVPVKKLKTAVKPKIQSKEAFEDASVAPEVLKAPKAAKMPKVAKIAETTPKSSAAKSAGNYFYANGKRKTSVAMVRLHINGKGTITVNGRTLENFFPVLTDQDKICSPLKMTKSFGTFDVSVQVHGGGVHSQAEAIRHGISKALLAHKSDLRTTLKHAGFLTRDSRVKERKKYGLKRARRSPQWAKR